MDKVEENTLIGKMFGKWVILKYEGRDKNNKHIYLCECVCEKHTKRIVSKYALTTGKSKSCGCNRGKSFIKDLTGKRFGKLTVIKREGYSTNKSNKKITWNCNCDCGSTNVIVVGEFLRNGHTSSCGCFYKNRYDLNGKYGIGYTNKNEPFYFDLEDYDNIKNYCWFKKKNGYIETTIKGGITKSFHRVIMNVTNTDVVDHINHNCIDNRKENLRICNASQNQANKKIQNNNTSGVTGVKWDKTSNKWVAQISIYKKRISKYFTNFDDAVKCRKYLEEMYFGEFAYNKEKDMVGLKNEI